MRPGVISCSNGVLGKGHGVFGCSDGVLGLRSCSDGVLCRSFQAWFYERLAVLLPTVPTATPRLFKWANMRSITYSEAAAFFGELGTESFSTEPHLSEDEQALIDGPLSWEIVSDDAQPKKKRRPRTVSDDNEEARSSAKRPNNNQEMQLVIVPEEEHGRRSKRERLSGASSNAAFEEGENSEIVVLLKQLLTKVDRMERSIADVIGSVEKQDSNVVDMKESIAKLSTSVDEIKSQLLPKSDKQEQPSVLRSCLKTPTSSGKVKFVLPENTHKPSSSSLITAKCKKTASKKNRSSSTMPMICWTTPSTCWSSRSRISASVLRAALHADITGSLCA